MSEGKEKSREVDEPLKSEPDAPVVPEPIAPIVLPEGPVDTEIADVKEKAFGKEGERKALLSALDIALVTGPKEATFSLGPETFTVGYWLDRGYVNFHINAGATEIITGTYHRDKVGKMVLGVGAKMKDAGVADQGYYSLLMEGLLQHVDFTENTVRNDEVDDAYKKYGQGDYVAPSLFAANAQLVSARKGFLCFRTAMTSEGAGAGMQLVGVRVPEELKIILENAKQWERGRAIPDYDPLQEAQKIKEYVSVHQEELTEQWGFYHKDCFRLLEMQIERFEQVAQLKEQAQKKEGQVAASPPKPWWRRIFGV